MSMMDDSRPQGGGGSMPSLSTMETNGRLMIQAVNGLQQILKVGFANTFPVSAPLAINNLGTSSIQVIGADSTRSALLFHNQNGSASVIVCPAFNANGTALAASFSLRGGGFLIQPKESFPFSGNCQMAWNAVADTGASNGLTISSV